MHAWDAATGAKLNKMTHFPQQQGPLLEISYLLLFSVVTLHCNGLYQI